MSHRALVRWLWPAPISAVVLSSTAVILSPSAAAKWSRSRAVCLGQRCAPEAAVRILGGRHHLQLN